MKLFYTNTRQNNTLIFDRNESGHIIRVLRFKTGDLINVTDGKGAIFTAKITDDNPGRCIAEIIKTETPQSGKGHYLHIAIAPTKNSDRIEWFVEKAVEMGIDEITPVICEHSERKKINTERLRRIMVSAIKQSVKPDITRINDALAFSDLVCSDFNGKKFIAYLDTESGNALLKDVCNRNEKTLIIIGPEGDFSKDEIEYAKQNNFIPVSLGGSRLRTETAGLAACCLIYWTNQ